MPPVIPGLLMLAWLLVLSAATGRRLMLWLNAAVPERAEFILLSVGLGFGALQFVPFALFTLCIGQPAGQRIAALLLTFALGRDTQATVRLCREWVCRFRCPVWLRIFLFVYMILLGCSFLRAICPPLSGDGLNYHLPAALRPLQAGRFVYLPTLTYTNWPSGTEMLFALVLGIHPEAPSALIQFVAGLIVCGAVYLLGQRMWGQHVGIAALVLLLLLKDFWGEISSSMVDVTLTAFTMLTLFCLERFFTSEEEEPHWTVLAALFAGLAATTKLTGIWVIVSAVSVYALALYRRKQARILMRAGLFGGTALLVVIPWFVKTWILTGNPFYPVLYHWFGGIEWTATGWERFQLAHLIYNTPAGFPPTPAVLYRTHRIIAIIGVSSGLLLVRCVWRSRYSISLSMVGLFLAGVSVSNYLNPRFLLPVLPALLLCIATPIKRIRWKNAVEWGLCLACVLLALPLISKPCKGWDATLSDAVLIASGRISVSVFQQTHLPDYSISRYANQHLSPTAHILLSGSQSAGLYRAQALISTYNLQDSIHYSSQFQLMNDLRRLHVGYLILSPYPADCDTNHACRLMRQAESPALEELAIEYGTPLYRTANATLYALSLKDSAD